jgi:hypothetical protein
MNKPIILDNAILRSGENDKIFEYDYKSDINIVKVGKARIPFIDIDTSSNELTTVTRVFRESDDEELSLLELKSKTEVTRERDDEEISLLELLSKTAQNRERDDDDISFLELESKTFIERERDDEENINYN